MKNLVQIIYISRSTFETTEISGGIEPNVARILHKSRTNNAKNGLVGVLYFGNGNFFQCLEGEEDAVDTLYRKLEEDPRHKDIKLLSKKRIAATSFSKWAMKFVPIDQLMQKLLVDNGYTKFDPYKFDDAMTHKVIELLMTGSDVDSLPLVQAKDASPNANSSKVASPNANSSKVASPNANSSNVDKAVNNTIAKVAMAFSVASLILSSAAIYLVTQ